MEKNVKALSPILEGVFFIRGQTKIEEDWCPICNKWTRYEESVRIIMDKIDERALCCGHQVTYFFLVEQITGEKIATVRKRFQNL